MQGLETHATAACCWCASKLVKLDGYWWCPTKDCRTKQRAWAIVRQVPKIERGQFAGYRTEFWWVPLPKQVAFLELSGKRKLMRGAVGPGKSKTARNGAYRLSLTVANLSVLLTRKTHPELERTHIKEMRREQDDLGFKWMEQAGQCRFPNGSVIECGHLEDEAAVQKYLSAEYDLIILEEAVQYKPDAIMELMSRARTSNEEVKKLGGPWVWLLTNPGGPSHHLLEALFIDQQPDIETYPAMAKFYKPEEWTSIHTNLDDNPYIDEDYAAIALSGLRKARYAQLRYGDWSAMDGAFFEVFDKRKHLRRVELHAPIDGVAEAMDWGYTAPGCWKAYAHVGDNHWHVLGEWKFKGLTPEQVAAGIKDRRTELGIGKVSYTVGDPSMFSKTRGDSIAETMSRHGVPLRPGNNERELGWMRLMAAYQDAPDGIPWLTYEPTCTYSARSIPALLADKNNPEDVDTSLDDHAADTCVTAETLITTETGARVITDVREGDRVWTRDGWRTVQQCQANGEKPIFDLRLSNGRCVKITGNHPVWTKNRGFIRADALRYSDILSVCENPLYWLMPLSLMASRFGVTLNRAGLKIAAITSQMGTGFSAVLNLYTERFGKPRTDQFQTGATFTTLMGTPATTTWATLNVCPALSTWRGIHGSGQSISLSWNAFDLLHPRGISQSPAAHVTALLQSVSGRSEHQIDLASARHAGPNFTATAPSGDFVRTIARLNFETDNKQTSKIGRVRCAARRIAAIVIRVVNRVRGSAVRVVDFSPAGIAPVFNLSVEGTPEYYANGLLVHNCRYWAMSRPSFSVAKPKEEPPKPNTWAWWRNWHESQNKGTGVLA